MSEFLWNNFDCEPNEICNKLLQLLPQRGVVFVGLGAESLFVQDCFSHRKQSSLVWR